MSPRALSLVAPLRACAFGSRGFAASPRALCLLSLALLGGCPPPRVEPQPLKVLAPTSRPAPASRPVDERAFWRGRADLIELPPVQPAAALAVAELRRARLKNGVRVLLLPSTTLPLVEVQLVVRAGSIDDPADKVGLAEFAVGMLRQGTRKLGADAHSERVDRAGASLGAFSEYELSGVSCSARSSELATCLEVLSEIVTQPTFPEKEMGEIRERLLTAIKQTRDDPASLAEQHFNNLLYGDGHPAGRPMTVDGVARISRADLVSFYRRQLVAGATLIGVSGDFDPKKIVAQLERAFGRWPAREAPARVLKPVVDPPPGLRVLLVDKPDLSQSFFALGHAGIRLGDPDRDSVRLLNYVLGGGGFSSRLMKSVRSEQGKTYGIKSQFDEGSIDGSFLVQSFTRNQELMATLELVRKELARIASAPPTEAELRAAKGDLAGGFAIRFQTAARVVGQLLRIEALGLPATFVTELPLRLERQSGAAVAAAARARVRSDRLVAAVVGKAEVVAPALRAAGIRFERVSYLDPISAGERRRARAPEAPPEVNAAEEKLARPLLERALKIAGGRERLGLIRSLRLVGKGRIEDVEGDYSVLLLLPDHLRVSFEFKQAQTSMIQILAGKQAFVAAGSARKALPAEVADRMRGMIWRDPVLLPLHALQPGVRARPSKDPLAKGLPRGQAAIDLFPPGLPATTVVLDRQSGYLLQIRHRGRSGGARVIELADHKRVLGGVLVPMLQTEAAPAKRKQTLRFERVELNAKITQADILR